MQKHLTVLLVPIFFLLFVGLSDSYAEHKKNPNAGHGGGDEGTPLCVTFRNSVNPVDRVTSDNNPEYCNDDDPTVGLATLSSKFIFTSSGVTGQTIPRQIRLDFSECVGGPCDDRDFSGAIMDGIEQPVDSASFQFQSDSHTDLELFPFMHPMPVGLILKFTLEGDKTTRTINFDPENLSWACPDPDNGNPVTVMRLTNGCWIVFSDQEGCLTASNSHAGGSSKRTASVEPQGTYHMPFLLMLEDVRAAEPDINGCPML